MGNRLFVGNLSWNTSEQDLRDTFSKCGSITDLKIVTDRETGRSRGFAFVQFGSDAEAGAAIQALDGSTLDGRTIAVKVAEERQRSGGGGGGGGRNYGPPRESGGGGGGGGDRGRGGGRDRGRRRRDDSDWG